MSSLEHPAAAQETGLVCAILAAQVRALQDGIASPAINQRLLGCADLLAVLSSHLAKDSEAASAAEQLEHALDGLAFQHAQSQDLARQTADLVAQALSLLATAEPAAVRNLSQGGLLALYVNEDQRRLHAAVVTEVMDAG
jgi:hypothetical protein